jgi:hypothetical protein
LGNPRQPMSSDCGSEGHGVEPRLQVAYTMRNTNLAISGRSLAIRCEPFSCMEATFRARWKVSDLTRSEDLGDSSRATARKGPTTARRRSSEPRSWRPTGSFGSVGDRPRGQPHPRAKPPHRLVRKGHPRVIPSRKPEMNARGDRDAVRRARWHLTQVPFSRTI